MHTEDLFIYIICGIAFIISIVMLIINYFKNIKHEKAYQEYKYQQGLLDISISNSLYQLDEIERKSKICLDEEELSKLREELYINQKEFRSLINQSKTLCIEWMKN